MWFVHRWEVNTTDVAELKKNLAVLKAPTLPAARVRLWTEMVQAHCGVYDEQLGPKWETVRGLVEVQIDQLSDKWKLKTVDHQQIYHAFYEFAHSHNTGAVARHLTLARQLVVWMHRAADKCCRAARPSKDMITSFRLYVQCMTNLLAMFQREPKKTEGLSGTTIEATAKAAWVRSLQARRTRELLQSAYPLPEDVAAHIVGAVSMGDKVASMVQTMGTNESLKPCTPRQFPEIPLTKVQSAHALLTAERDAMSWPWSIPLNMWCMTVQKTWNVPSHRFALNTLTFGWL